MYETKLIIEVSVKTQFGPTDAVSMVTSLLRVPAITSVNLTELDTDYVSPLGFPLDRNLKTMSDIPTKLI